MPKPDPLPLEKLYYQCDPSQFDFETTADLETPREEVIGQERAVEAIQFSIGIQHDGFNLFALGPTGAGKQTAVRRYLRQKAPEHDTPDDWCYVHNFEEPYKPAALRMPPGRAADLRSDMEKLVEELQTVIPAAFTSEEYQAQQKAIEEQFQEQQSTALEDLREKAKERGIALVRTPNGFAFAPMKDGEVVQPDEYMELPPEEQERVEGEINELQDNLRNLMEQVPQWRRNVQEQLNELNEEVASFAVAQLFDELRQEYEDLPTVIDYLDAVEQDVIENFEQFLENEQESQSPLAAMMGGGNNRGPRRRRRFSRYQVNVVIDNGETDGAPIVYEAKPTYSNLIGRIEHTSQMGALRTDFTLIKPGVLHKANGGYLILDARKLLMEPYAWESLKHALRTDEIRIESLGQAYSLINTVSLEPEPLPLNVKVILLGERRLYYLLSHHDPDFAELFKVAADFEDQMDRDEENNQAYARLIAEVAQKEELRPFDREAVARVIEHGARLAGDAEKLTAHMQSITDLLREANYWAKMSDHERVSGEDVKQALEAQRYRAGRIRERIQEAIIRDTILIDTKGEVVGQINGLSVFMLGNYPFGRPNRITARVRLGKGEVVDIERQVDMGGPIHSKGVMILTGFLGARYAAERPLSLSATLVFEQSYSGVDGDSASSAELYALLSALAEAPLNQSLAVTGSINQRGQVQAIGGVNEKIEGFFEVCQARGLTGEQGVLIPASNVDNLMLRQEVRDAVADGRFSIYPVQTVDEGIELLTGVPAGEPDEDGNYPEESINGRVVARLEKMAKTQRRFARPPQEKGGEEEKENDSDEEGEATVKGMKV